LEASLKPEHEQLWQRLVAFQFDDPAAALTFTQRLARENGWSVGFADQIVDEYRRFLFLAMTAGHEVTPSDEVDQAWHLHLTFSRSYWQELCAETLGTPLHHGPTRGGKSDGSKYRLLYEQTLQSYRETFREEPPVDIWPGIGERFANPARFVRVDRAKSWVIPKPWHVLKLLPRPRKETIVLAALPLVIFALENPLNFAGPEFLQFYSLLMLMLTLAAGTLRFMLRPGENLSPQPLDVNQIACLAGGVEGTIKAAVASLVDRGALEVVRHSNVDMKDLWIRNHHGTPPDASELEQRIVVVCNELSGCRFGKLVEHAKPAAEKIRHRLEAWGLMIPSEGVPACCWMPAALMSIGMLVGIAKLFVGVQRGKPVGFLVLLLLAFGAVTIFFFFRPLRTRAGDSELKRLRHSRPDLRLAHRAPRDDPKRETDIALAAAMFGLGAVAYGELAALPNAWKYRNGPPVGSDGSSSGGCGTSGCGGGGGCGGGCGGCS
jgi:uncharacterized protein (TIGR04222 family)